MVHKLIRQFVGLDLLCVAGRQRDNASADTASDSFLIHVDLAERVHGGFALAAVEWHVGDGGGVDVL